MRSRSRGFGTIGWLRAGDVRRSCRYRAGAGTPRSPRSPRLARPLLRLARRVLPLTDRYHGPRFWVQEAGKWVATPLFLVLLLVEMTDLVFAIDSIPAIFAVTQEPYLVYTANVFAILGLRSMYFLLAGVVHRFVCLKYGLAAVLVFVGAKMMLVDVFKIPVATSLAVVATLIGGAIVLSLRRSRPGPLGSVAGVIPPPPTRA